MDNVLIEGLNQFFAQYSSTQKLVDHLIKAQSHPQEILILLCSRIDALASGAAREDDPSGRSFADFVRTYGGQSKLFDSVSVGDLYYELDYHAWLMPGMIEKAGRIHTFSRLNDPMLRLLVDSEIPLTLQDCRALTKRIQQALRRHFRVNPNQAATKPELASVAEIKRVIVDEFARFRDLDTKRALPRAVSPLVDSKKLAQILYLKFRCEAIHGGHIEIDEERFFTEKRPYWKAVRSEFYGPFRWVEFPAKFLASLLSNCLSNYRKRLERTGKIPPNIHFQIFPDDIFQRLDLLDEALLPSGRTAVPR